MTVGQLIDILKTHDLGDIVLLDGYESGLCDVLAANIQQIKFDKDVNISAYAGEHEEDKNGAFSGVVIHRGNEL